MSSEPNSWRDWIGRTEAHTDLVTAAPLFALSATLDRDDARPGPGSEVPPLWHWLYFMPVAKARDIGPDGHPKRGGFLPPVPLPRRMWAGARLTFAHALRVGDEVTRRSRIADVTTKEGRSGTLVFVTVHHEYLDARGVAITEEHDIVYRDMPPPGTPSPAAKSVPAPSGETYAREIAPDPVLLFRYSALTFNGHRIHYDRSYVTGVEGYPGLVVHGPLIATLLLDNLRRHQPGARVKAFRFKAVSPLFDIHRFTVCGRADDAHGHTLWARNHEGGLAMEAAAELA
ncbi:MAG: MaoC family dehydratase N-terminal domain-containing protein [Burkholderiales bacterium]|nr:MaoC family dehydratase N-terminal domain-containing protein [Burkholderiales bacterium]MCE7876391.1 acyl-CoA dehydrogenase [Betaproteobacteria bacterium PRO3]